MELVGGKIALFGAGGARRRRLRWASRAIVRVKRRALYVSCPRPGHWSVFISGLVEHPLAVTERIEKTLADQDG